MTYFIKRVFLLLMIVGMFSCQEKSKKTNILLIMVDDMGFSDLGFMGSKISTPNIDMLAQNGVMYNQFYNTGRCCPSRASLLTGLYAHNTGMGWMTASNLGHPGYTGDLNDECITIAQALQENDYACYVTGKWHLTHDKFMGHEGPKHNWPMQRGFDKFYGHLTGGGDYFNTGTMVWNNTRLDSLPDDFYLTTAVTDSTVGFLDQHFTSSQNRPFFFYVAYYAPHRPLHALPQDVDKYRGKYMDGWDELRDHKMTVLYESGIADSSNWFLSERDSGIKPWKDLSEDEKKIWDARMAVYAAQMDRMDQGIGDILNKLKEYDQLENTVVIFLSDNGGCEEAQGGELKLEQLSKMGNKFPKQSYRKEWANASNTPFRFYKKWVHEGGISTPLIIHWPEEIKESGLITDQVGHIIDIFPTILEISDTKYPKTYNGKEIMELQGKSIVKSLNNETFPREPLFFEHEANRAIRHENWKLVSLGTTESPYTSPWELYDLSTDRAETNNLAQKYPEKVDQLSAMWDEWAKNNNVYPLDGRDWGAKIKAGQEPVPHN